MEPIIHAEQLRPIVTPLLHWYDKNARILPWRENPLPYHVWVSEIMLQQTRVEAVKPYYERFLSALPNISSLASANEDLLMKLWEGLGYYSRVRNLQKAARIVMEEYNGELPRSVALLQKLPGIGPYTAGAIASIAYGLPAPAVDGNVLRVISRITASFADITSLQVKKDMEHAIANILPVGRVGDFNQALMELGATVCLPNGVALCSQCPMNGICKAQQQDIVMQLPVKTPKKQRKWEEHTVLIVISNGRVALRKRPKGGLLAGLWEFPNLPGTLSKEEVADLAAQWGCGGCSLLSLRGAKHIFTHVEWHMIGYCIHLDHPAGPTEWVWVNRDELEQQYALPGAFRVFSQFVQSYLP